MMDEDNTDPNVPDEVSEGYDAVLYPPNVKWLLYPDEEDIQNVSHSLESLQVTGKYRLWLLLYFLDHNNIVSFKDISVDSSEQTPSMLKKRSSRERDDKLEFSFGKKSQNSKESIDSPHLFVPTIPSYQPDFRIPTITVSKTCG